MDDDDSTAATQHTIRRQWVPTAFLVVFTSLPVLASTPAELEELVTVALAENPAVQAARHYVAQILTKHEAVLGFLDPQATAAFGTSKRVRAVPGSTDFPSLTSDATVAQAGVEVPLRPGAYLAVGMAEKLLFDALDSERDVYQTLFGARLRIPLGRDRGFRQWDMDRAHAVAEYNHAVSRLIGAAQTLRHGVERDYIAVLETREALEVARTAAERLRVLLQEAQELVRLKVVPEYQLHPTMMELALRQEEELQAKRNHELSILQLEKSVGAGRDVRPQEGLGTLLSWAAAATLPVSAVAGRKAEARGDYLQILNQIDMVETDIIQARDKLRSDVSLNLGATWQGDDADNVIPDGRDVSERHFGGEVVLVWRRPFRYRAERAEIKRLDARIRELKEDLRGVGIEADVAADSAVVEFGKARERLKLLDGAAKAAQLTLKAEEERFRLGEARSRQVLDAQKDLNTVNQRRARTAAILLRAWADYLHAVGYDGQLRSVEEGQP